MGTEHIDVGSDCIQQSGGDVDAVGTVQLANTGRAMRDPGQRR